MNYILISFLISCLIFPTAGFAKSKTEVFENNLLTIDHNVQAQIFAIQKTKYYTAVEIGFTNPTNSYLPFAAREIYLDGKNTYSRPPLTMDEVKNIELKKPSASLFPLAIAGALGIASLATAKASGNVAYGLGVGALGMVGASLLTKGFENRAQQNRFIAFENNTFADIKKLPPGMTLGGVLYFPPVKNPKSVTLMTHKSDGTFTKREFLVESKK